MSRFSRTLPSRAIATVVVAGIVIGAGVEYHRTHRADASAAPASTPAKSTVASAAQPMPKATVPPRAPASDMPPMLSATTPPPVPAVPAATTSVATVLADAKAKSNAGDLLGARQLLNDALIAGGTSDADTAALKSDLTELQKVLLFGSRAFPKDPLASGYKVVSGDRLSTIAKQQGVPYELLMDVNHMANPRQLRSGQTLKVINGPFHAVVSKSKFTLDIYLGAPGGPGSTFVESFPVGLGESGSTPTGSWEIKNKAPSPTWYNPRGGGDPIPAGDPKNPLGPFWLGLEGTDGNAVGAESYGIHGTIDPSSIGKMSSMGCVRLRNADITAVYKLLVEKKSKVRVTD